MKTGPLIDNGPVLTIAVQAYLNRTLHETSAVRDGSMRGSVGKPCKPLYTIERVTSTPDLQFVNVA